MSRGRAHTTFTAEGAAHTRFASSDDDESVDDGEQVERVGLQSLADDLLTHLVKFVPECRDVLSLAVVHALPEPAWRAAHEGLLPGLHRNPRRTHRSAAHPVTHRVGVADGPKTWRERFVGGARLLDPHAQPTVVETVLGVEDGVGWTLCCVREDGVVMLRDHMPPHLTPEARKAFSEAHVNTAFGETFWGRPTATQKVSRAEFWALAPDGSFARAALAPLVGSWREFMVDGDELAVVDYAFDNITVFTLPTLAVKTRIAIDRQPAGPEGVPVGSQIIFETGCAYNKRTGEFVFGLSHGVQIVHGSPIYAEEGKDNMTLYAHRGDTHAHDLYGFHHWRASNSGWQVVYDRVLSTLVFYDHGSKTIVIWTIKTTEFEGEVAPGVERWREFPEMILHEIEIDDPYGSGVDAIHFVSDDGLDDLLRAHGRTMVVASRTSVHVYDVGGTHTRPGAPPERAGRPAQCYRTVDLGDIGPERWIEAIEDEEIHEHELVCAVVPDRHWAKGLAFVAALVPDSRSQADPVAWIRLDLKSLFLYTSSRPVGTVAQMEIVSARADVASPDGRIWFIPAAYPRDKGGLSHLKLMRDHVERDDMEHFKDAALFELRSDATSPAECTRSRGSAASEWFDEHFTYRTKEDCYHIPPAFLVGNCFIVYSSRQTQPRTRAKFTVWRF